MIWSPLFFLQSFCYHVKFMTWKRFLGKVPKTGWGGGALFRAAFGRAWVPPPFSAALGYTPPIWDDHLVSPPFPKIFFFQKVRMRFATFLYYPKRHDVIKFKVLCHWISLIWMTRSANKLIWMGKSLKLGDMRAQCEKIFWYGSRPPPHFPVF